MFQKKSTKSKKKTNRNGQWTQTSRHFNQTMFVAVKANKKKNCISVTGTLEEEKKVTLEWKMKQNFDSGKPSCLLLFSSNSFCYNDCKTEYKKIYNLL